MTTAYPPQWPAGWPRTSDKKRGKSRFTTTFDRARRILLDELRKLGARNIVLSSNVPLCNDGQPHADWSRRRMDDPGIAVYFTLRNRQMVMAHDRYWTVGENLHALGHAIAHLRGLDRHGGGVMMERAFAGFAALPPPIPQRPWRVVLDFAADARLTDADIAARYRYLAKQRHPDAGGSDATMAELNAARDEAVRHMRGG